MSLTLVPSGDERALAIRDHLLAVVRVRGTLQMQDGPLRLIVFEADQWVVNHWTPLNALTAEEASSPGCRHALARQHTLPDLPYGLDVWHGEKVFSILWSDEVITRMAHAASSPWRVLTDGRRRVRPARG